MGPKTCFLGELLEVRIFIFSQNLPIFRRKFEQEGAQKTQTQPNLAIARFPGQHSRNDAPSHGRRPKFDTSEILSK
jgi:hypothetical protein